MGYDHREINHHWFESFDEKTMRAEVWMIMEGDIDELVFVPCVYDVCDVCNGKGTHVNPGVDSNGLSSEDFDRDPDFYEDYMSGMYDVSCVSCNGRRVIPHPNFPAMDAKLAAQVQDHIESFFQNQRDMHREREMGY